MNSPSTLGIEACKLNADFEIQPRNRREFHLPSPAEGMHHFTVEHSVNSRRQPPGLRIEPVREGDALPHGLQQRYRRNGALTSPGIVRPIQGIGAEAPQ